MFKTICVLGRQPALSLAELESLFGADNVMPCGHNSALLNIDYKDVPFSRLGGTIKLGKVITELPSSKWQDIVAHITANAPKYLAEFPEGKIRFGLSVYGAKIKPPAINAAALTVKKQTKALGRSIRVVPNNEPSLSSAQVLHNRLTQPLGAEMLVVVRDNKTVLALTKNIQDIDAYAARDQKRPKRDARVGMLPPKLAQIIINLASKPPRISEGGVDTSTYGKVLLDPFCGTGVILQEALLMDYDVYGTDIETRMTEYTQHNLEWLEIAFADFMGDTIVNNTEVGDATSYEWRGFDTIACETYLGRPFSTEPNPQKLREVIQDVNTIHKKFLANVARQTKPGLQMCIAVPAWFTKRGVQHLPVLDHLRELGYTRMSFVHAKDKDLIYHREGQIVGRELVTLIRK